MSLKRIGEIDFSQINDQRPNLLPFESPIEKELAYVIQKYLHEEAVLKNQVSISTPNGNFRLDFLVSFDGHHVAFEANGKEFHDYDTDMVRGSLILGYSEVTSIYYIRGRDIVYHPESALCAISKLEPSIFSERGKKNLKQLSESGIPEGRETVCTELMFGFSPPKEENFMHEPDTVYIITRLSKKMKNPVWKRLHSLALDYPGKTIKELISISDAENRSWYRD